MDSPILPPHLYLPNTNKPAQDIHSEKDDAAASHDSDHVQKDWKFWCIIFSLALSIVLTAVEFVSRPHLLIWPALSQVALASRNSYSNMLRHIRRPRSELHFQRSYVTSRAHNSSGSALRMRWARPLWCLFVAGSHRCHIPLARKKTWV
jgi:hypothetical protein